MLICVKDNKKGQIRRLRADEAHELVAKGLGVYVSRAVAKAVEAGIDEGTARKLHDDWPKLRKMIQAAKAPKKKGKDEDEEGDEA